MANYKLDGEMEGPAAAAKLRTVGRERQKKALLSPPPPTQLLQCNAVLTLAYKISSQKNRINSDTLGT